MADFLFAFPDKAAMGPYTGCVYHMGAAYIRAYGGYAPTEVDTFLSSSKLTWDETAGAICDSARKAVGFSVYDANYSLVAGLARRVKELRPELVVVCGGPTATCSAQRIMDDCSAIDLCVVGEGELTFRDLCRTGFEPRAWAEIPGLVVRAGGDLLRTPARELYRNREDAGAALRGIPSPYLSGIVPLSDAPSIGVFTTRGCSHACTFCAFAALNRHTLRRYPESQVVGELRAICAHFGKSGQRVCIPIHDDNFTADVERCRRILGELLGFRPPNVEFRVESRADSRADDAFYSLARRAGIAEVNFGLESAVPEVLALVRKVRPRPDRGTDRERAFVEDVQDSVKMARRHGMSVSVSIILGLPGDSPERAKATLDVVRRLPLDRYAHNILHIHDGTELAQTHREFGIDRVPHGTLPLLQTVHAYDAEAIAHFEHSRTMQRYRQDVMSWVLYVLAGMVNRYSPPSMHSVLLDTGRAISDGALDRLAAGTAVFCLPGSNRLEGWRARNFWCCSLEPGGAGCTVHPLPYKQCVSAPAVLLPGRGGPIDHGRSSVQMVEVIPGEKLPESQEKHWRLPYAACGLLPEPCPARAGRLVGTCGGTFGCAFHGTEAGPAELAQCLGCSAGSSCPRCTPLMRRFGDDYCAHHRGARPWMLLAYLIAHFHAFLDLSVDWTMLPPVRLDDQAAASKEKCVVRIGGRGLLVIDFARDFQLLVAE